MTSSIRTRSRVATLLAGAAAMLLLSATPSIAAPKPPPVTASVPVPVTSFTMFSDSGDYIGAGVPREFDSTNSTISGGALATGISMNVSGGTTGTAFNVTIAPPPGDTFETGFYTRAQRTPFREAGHPGIDISGDGRGCNQDSGSFDVRDIAFSGGTITRLHLLYEQHCEGGTAALFGELRINEPATGGLVVSSGAITGRAAFPGAGATPVPVYVRNPSGVPVTLGATSLAGPNAADFHVQLDGCSGQTVAAHASCLLYVGSTPSVAGPRTAELRLTLPSGVVHIQLDGSGRVGTTSFDMTSDPGDYIGAGSTYHFTTGVSVSGSVAGISGGVNAPDGQWWYFDFVPASGHIIAPGTYDNATRYPFNGSGNGLSVYGNGRGCNNLTGSFTVQKVDYSPIDGSLQQLDLTFVQHCEGGVPALRGELKWNWSPVSAATPVHGLSVSPGGAHATVSWTDPSDANFAYAVVRHHAGSPYGVAPIAGISDYSGTGTTTVLDGLDPLLATTVEVFAIDRYGNVSDPVLLTFGSMSGYTPLSPTRILDTRTANVPANWAPNTPVGPGQTLTLPVAGDNGIPSSAVAVVLNLTATDVSAPTFVSAHPAGSTTPTASNLNLVPGDTRPNLVTVALGVNGAVDLTNDSGSVNLIADVAGFYSTDGPGRFTPLSPTRVLDTRTAEVPSTWTPSTPVGPGQTVDLPIAGTHGVPADATSVVVNLTGVSPSASTFITAFPAGQAPPTVSNLNLAPGTIVPNLAVVKVGANGHISLRNALGNIHLVVDVVGAYGPSGADLFVPTSPRRLLDTRTANVPGSWPVATPLGPGGILDLPAAGTAGIDPAAVAVLLNLTATDVTAATFVTAYPSGQGVPNASNLNLVPGDTRANLASVRLGSNGHLLLRNEGGSVDLIADLAGYFVPAPAPSGAPPT